MIIDPTHLPTAILVIGYICYWFELYFIKMGRGLTSPSAYIIFIGYTVCLLVIKRKNIYSFLNFLLEGYKKQTKIVKLIILSNLAICIFMLIMVFCVLLKPPHTPQETDALNYHLTLPRQHLLLGSFKHIWWSSADLFPLPIQFALSPYWLINSIPSRFIQIFFILGLLAVSAGLTKEFSGNNFLSVCLVILAILGSHSIGIQMPILMLDLVLAYLFVACVDSFIKGAYLLSMVEFSFLFWSKSFQPLQFSLILVFMTALVLILKIFKVNRYSYAFDFSVKPIISLRLMGKVLLIFLIVSVFVGFPFIAKSVYYAKTPLFPFNPGITPVFALDMNSSHWESIIYSSKMHLTGRDIYGSGRHLLDFVRHLWIIAVPESKMGGVMNRYDYPLGLPYLLFIGPFIYFLVKSIKEKEFAILPIFVIAYWIIWWFGSQQARFLYIPLVIIFITVSSLNKIPHKILIVALFFALLLNFASIFRAHAREFKLTAKELIRENDNKLLELNEKYYGQQIKEIITLDRFDISYAQFPADVRLKNKNHWVLEK